ncbi:hypothetical protein SADUNF_Sadunf14G0038500 [Salix dunnii]|uniref:Uncharacterized protein n=1 Tax=Salix dunnii TaxID=1413687 RepID=A0A835JDY6_9ROSI|nr:hypothetical protein SADUNF_Sadunf14G0038500 [Salix dunnii]
MTAVFHNLHICKFITSCTMKPESKKNRSKSTNKSEGNTASSSCYDLTALSQALDDQEPANNNKDKSSFDFSNISEALNTAAKKDNRKKMRRLEVLRSIAQSQEEAKTRQMRARRQRYICETWSARETTGGRVHGERNFFPVPIFSLGGTRTGRAAHWIVRGLCRTNTVGEVMDDIS